MRLLWVRRSLMFIAILLNSLVVEAFIYEGFLTDSNDIPQVGAVSLKLAIYYDVNKTCKVYEVTSDFTLTDLDQGYFKVDLNSATPTSDSKNSSLTKVFQYKGTLLCSNASSITAGSFSSVAREMVVSIKNVAGEYVEVGSFTIYEIPRAMQAGNAEKFSDKLVTDFLTKDLIQTCQSGAFLQYSVSSGSFGCGTVLSNITSADITTTLGYTPLNVNGGTISGSLTTTGPLVITGTSASPQPGAIWFNSSDNTIKFATTSGSIQTLGVSGSGIQGINGDNSAGAHTIQLATTGSNTFNSTNSGGGVHTLNIPMASASASYGLVSNTDYNSFKNKLDASGGTISGVLTVGTITTASGALNISNSISVTGNVGTNSLSVGTTGASFYSGANSVTFRAPSSISGNSSYTWPVSNPASTGMVLISSTSGSLSWAQDNGGSVTAVVAGAGLSGGTIATAGTISLGLSGVSANSYGSNISVATFQVDSYGRITAAGAVGIPTASSGTAGLLSSANWTTFNNKLDAAGGSMSGALNMSNNEITNVKAVTSSTIAIARGASLVTIKPAASFASYVLTLPDTDGTIGQVLKTDGAGGLDWADGLNTATVYGGEVTGTYNSLTVGTVGGKTAAQIAASVVDTAAATNVNTASTIVKRDTLGNFSSGTMTGSLVGNVTGNVTGNITGNVTGAASNNVLKAGDTMSGALDMGNNEITNVKAVTSSTIAIARGASVVTIKPAASFTSYVLTLPDTDGTIGQVLKTDGAGGLDWADGLNTATVYGGEVTGTYNSLTVGTVGGKTAAQIAASVVDTAAATNVNTASTIVKRDTLGNFSSGTMTGSLVGNVTGNVAGNITGNVTGNVTGSASNNVLKAGDTMNGTFNLFGGLFNITSNNTAASTLIVQGTLSQSAALTRWNDNLGNEVASIGPGGELIVKTFKMTNLPATNSVLTSIDNNGNGAWSSSIGIAGASITSATITTGTITTANLGNANIGAANINFVNITNGTVVLQSATVQTATMADIISSGTLGIKLNAVPAVGPLVGCDSANEGRVVYKRGAVTSGQLCICVDTDGEDTGVVYGWERVSAPGTACP